MQKNKELKPCWTILQVLNLTKRFQGQVPKGAHRLPVAVYPPHFAGTIQQVLAVGEIDDEVWTDDVADYIEPGDTVINVGDDDTPADEGRPPQVTAAELSSLDEAARYEETTRLLEMGVLQEPTHEDLEEGVILSTRSVMDWRFREQRWRRRCRLWQENSNDLTKVLHQHLPQRWSKASASDALLFSLVPQLH